jgi:LysM repeat protein
MYGVSQADIVKLNPGSNEKIYVGRTLRIPRILTNAVKETFHTIEKGETLYRLTVKYGVSAKLICEANPGLSADNFRIGEVIRIPSEKEQILSGEPVPAESSTAATTLPASVESRCRSMHKVKRKETVYSISRKYAISEAELIAANPELKGEDKIKKGTLLCIPYPAQETTDTDKSKLPPTDSELFDANKTPWKRISTVRAAIILPFLEGGEQNKTTLRTVEYYEGFLMAVDSLKRKGVSIDLYTYNSGNDKNTLNAILAKPEMTRMDVIFGPLHPVQIKPLADFADRHNIRLVIPFTSKDNTVFQNPSIYQVNTPQSYLYSEVYNHFVRQFPAAHVIFVEATNDTQEKADFIKGLKDELYNHGIPSATIPESATADELKTLLRADRQNIFLPTSGSNITLIKILPQLTLLVRSNPEAAVHLFGYPEWQTYTKDHLEAFFELDTYFYSSFYTNNLLPASIRFIHNYRKWYGKEMDDSYPRFGMLGFDTGFFFLNGLWRYGSNFEQKMQEMSLIPIQTGFKFERVNNFGGFINRKVFFVHFTRNYELLKLDYD